MPTPTEDIVAREHTIRSETNTSALGCTIHGTVAAARSNAAALEHAQQEQKLI